MDSQLAGGFLKHTLFPPGDFSPYRVSLPNGVTLNHLDIGVLEVVPNNAQGAIVISSGIHGDETAPIELVDGLVEAVIQQELIPQQRTLFIIAHPAAIHAHTRFIDENLNRLFSRRNPERNPECVLANKLQAYVDAFFDRVDGERWHFDLHSAIRDSEHYMFGVVPVSSKGTDIRPLVAFLKAAHMDAMMLSRTPSSTFSWFSAEHYGAQAATFEMGRVAPLYQNNMAEFLPLRNALTALIGGEPLPIPSADKTFPIYKVTRTITKTDQAFRLAFSDDAANFTYFKQGELLAEENGTEYHAIEGGEAVVFPNSKVAIGQRAALLVQPFEADLSMPLCVNIDNEPGPFVPR